MSIVNYTANPDLLSTMTPDHIAAVTAYWDEVAPVYLGMFGDELEGKPAEVVLLREFAHSLGPSARVCDLGCGPCAHITRVLADMGAETIGIDVSPACVVLARIEQPTLDLRVMNAVHLDFPDSHFDGLVAWYLIHYVPRADWGDLFREFARVLRPGGKLLLAAKEGDSDGWIPDPLGGDLPTWWAAASNADLEDVLAAADLAPRQNLSRTALPNEIQVRRGVILVECIKPSPPWPVAVLAPPWEAFPGYDDPFHVSWRTGSAQDIYEDFCTWFCSLDRDLKKRFETEHPAPKHWAEFYHRLHR